MLTAQERRQKYRNESYWKEREASWQAERLSKDTEYKTTLNDIYSDMTVNIDQQIESFFSKYARSEGITMSEAKQRVSQADIDAFSRKAKKYVAEKDFSDQANEEMRLYNLTMKVNRLELLKSQIGLEMTAGFNELEDYMGRAITDATQAEFERQAGILGETILNNEKTARAIADNSFRNATYSERIWSNNDILRNEISNLLSEAFIQGKGIDELTAKLQKRMDVSKSDAERLLKTEIRRAATEAERQSLERDGYDEYQIFCREGACPLCRPLDDKTFAVEDMEIGVNAPPFHPNCRCSIGPYMDDEAYESWLDSGAAREGADFDEYQKTYRNFSHKNNNRTENDGTESSFGGIIKTSKLLNVLSDGKRNERPLTNDEIQEAENAMRKQGYDGEIFYSQYSNTAFHGSTEGIPFHYMVIGTDAFPTQKTEGTANEKISVDACAAHEYGHYSAWKRGTTQETEALEEAQASLRAAKFGVDLTEEDRNLLRQDALDRLKKAEIQLKDVEEKLDIWEM